MSGESSWYDLSSYLPWTGYSGRYGGWVNDQLVEYLDIENIVNGFDSSLNEEGEYYECFLSGSASFEFGIGGGILMKIERVSTGSDIFDLTWEVQGSVSFTIQPGAKVLVDIGAEIKALLTVAPKVTIRLKNKKETIQGLAIMARLIIAGTMPSIVGPITGSIASYILMDHTWDDIDWIKRRISKAKFEVSGAIEAEIVAEAEVTDNWSLISAHIGAGIEARTGIELSLDKNKWELERTVEVLGTFTSAGNLLGWGAGVKMEHKTFVGHKIRVFDQETSHTPWSIILSTRNISESASRKLWRIIKFYDYTLSAGFSTGVDLGISESLLDRSALELKFSCNTSQLISALHLLVTNPDDVGILDMLNSLSTSFPESAFNEIKLDHQNLMGWVLDEEIKVAGVGLGIRFGSRTCTHYSGYPKKVIVRPSDIANWVMSN